MTEEEKRAQRCCIVCGRPSCLKQYKQPELIAALSRSVHDAIDSGIRTFIIPYRDGYDAIAANVIVNIKKKVRDLRIVVAKPKSQAQKGMTRREEFLLRSCDLAVNIDEGQKFYPSIMLDRWMVDHSSRLIVCRGDDFNDDINTLITYAEEQNVLVDDFVKYDMLRTYQKRKRTRENPYG